MATLGKDNETQSYIREDFSYFPNGDGGMNQEGVKEPATGEGTQATATTEGPVAGTSSTSDNEAGGMTDEQKEAIRPYEEQIRMLKERAASVAPESEEARAKREKRERSRKIIGAVSDGLRSLGNLFFTSQYAPDMYEGSTRMLDRTNKSIEKAKAERERNNDLYFNYSMKIGDKEAEMAKTLRDLEAQREARKLAKAEAERKDRELAMKEEEHPFRLRGAEADANKKESDAEYSKVKAKNAPKEMELKNRNLELQGDVHRSAVTKNQAQAANANRGNVKEFSAWDENGKEHKFKTKDAAESFAKQHGTWQEVDQTTETMTDSELNGQTSKTEIKKGGYPKKPIKGTMPGVKTNDNNKMPGVK
ncbi:MAG: hypothetical protein J1E16_04110 [Muribaculaceae bacterium]|nr:hypothetical protein [Muribaculaceae bacterium]